MTNDNIVTELLAMRARIDDFIEAVRKIPEETAAPTKPDPRWMKLTDFGARWQLSRGTMYARIAEGLPVSGEGHDRRVKVKDGDEWMRRRAPGRRA